MDAAAAVVAEFIEIAYRIAPIDLAERPLYVVQVSQLDAWQSWIPADTTGLAGPDLDLSLHHVIERTQRWRGRGHCIVLNDVGWAAFSTTQETFRRNMLGTFLHEFSHCLEADRDFESPPEPTPAALAEAVAEHSRAVECFHVDRANVPGWFTHNLNWIRAAVHVVERAQLAGAEVSLVDVVDTRRYSLGRVCRYKQAMLPETDALGAASFAEIRNAVPPAALVDVYAAALREWYANLPEPGRLDAAAMVSEITRWAKIVSPLKPPAAAAA